MGLFEIAVGWMIGRDIAKERAKRDEARELQNQVNQLILDRARTSQALEREASYRQGEREIGYNTDRYLNAAPQQSYSVLITVVGFSKSSSFPCISDGTLNVDDLFYKVHGYARPKHWAVYVNGRRCSGFYVPQPGENVVTGKE